MAQTNNNWLEAFRTLGLSAFLAIGVRTFVAEARYIPSESMLPTLEVNDRLMIEKLSYRFKTPQRGDVIVFMPPDEARLCTGETQKQAYIKRAIGLPGDVVEVKNSQVYINNKLLKEDYIQESPYYQYGPVTVPPNSYLVLGDNRNNSCDGHYWGFVPHENLIGRATVRYWPFNRFGTLD
ncbi:signal peptidase I [Lusitaniella coriacea LEGE 07157]|uniref:Signal peptidase I n=1 Tax=Lusitaniella coriacea LEGE 07157 TaxID=945747 RepID=A0A8J7E0Z5_9CYAN|nr:signal peptidase I [Lusitaniella coriacea]MBE9119090.1 signal peptidase I [Lusitaniella coriacea LEGE 07157]